MKVNHVKVANFQVANMSFNVIRDAVKLRRSTAFETTYNSRANFRIYSTLLTC